MAVKMLVFQHETGGGAMHANSPYVAEFVRSFDPAVLARTEWMIVDGDIRSAQFPTTHKEDPTDLTVNEHDDG